MGCCGSKPGIEKLKSEHDEDVRLRANDDTTTTTTKGDVVDSSTISLQVLDRAMDKKESRKSDVSGGDRAMDKKESRKSDVSGGDQVPEMQSMQGKQRSSAPLASPRGRGSEASDRKSGQRSSGDIPPSRQGSSYISDIGSNTASLTKTLSVVHNESSIAKMEEVYDLSNATVIGRGGNGSVSVVTRRGRPDQKFALKTIKTEELTPKLRRELQQEIDVQKSLDHPNIVRIYESFEDVEKGEVFIIMELCTGGSLVSRLGSKMHRHGYGEAAAATLMEEMLSAVLYCHQHGVVHRDIKLDNFIFENEAEDSVLKLIDFGYACNVKPGQDSMWEKLGTPSYMAPELWAPDERGYKYDSSVDMWALGVVCFLLLSGQRPWFHKDMRERARMIRDDPVSFGSERWDKVGDEARDFVRCLLQKDPAHRLSARDAMSHGWITSRSELHAVDGAHDLQEHAEIVQALQAFSHADELKKVALEVIAFATPAQALEELRGVFVHMDEDNSGTIDLQEFRKAMTTHPEIPTEQVDMIFDHMDINKTGEVDYSEFLAAAISSQQTMDAPSVATAFGLLDKDGDGYLTKADLMDTIGSEGQGFTEGDIDELLLSAAFGVQQTDRRSSDDGGEGARPFAGRAAVRPEEVKLTVQDFKYLMLSQKSRKMSLSLVEGSHKQLNTLVEMSGKIYRSAGRDSSNRESSARGGPLEQPSR